MNHDRNSPFYATIVERFCLNNAASTKKTYHIILDLKGSNISYKVGDSLGILPMNNPQIVNFLIKRLNASAETLIKNKKGETRPLLSFLLYSADLKKISKSLLWIMHERSNILSELLLEENKEDLKAYIEKRDVVDCLFENPDCLLSTQEFCDQLFPLLPRFYSIASSMKIVGNEAHLTVGLIDYEHNGKVKNGVCSQFLCETAPLMLPVVPVYHQPSHEFTLPSDSYEKPIIMVGPGTGIAPFRGFMQERKFHGSSSKNWLFFGERHRHSDFYYENDWTALQNQGLLKVDLAFSRDQECKIYVQNRMLENSKEVWNWLEEGAYFFVCGDASRMAKDVDIALKEIILKEGHKDPSQVKDYIKLLKNSKRYLRDIY